MTLHRSVTKLIENLEGTVFFPSEKATRVLDLISKLTGIDVENLERAALKHSEDSHHIYEMQVNWEDRSIPYGCRLDGAGNIRTPEGTINNCLLAWSGSEVDPQYGPCAICNGTCPDRGKIMVRGGIHEVD